ncbi:MAG: biotin synthase BioB [Candidatus Dadabacteria bacterium]|nr:MAG: biotin synthase BioB [Candidatus Dadabacteria bacterium]
MTTTFPIRTDWTRDEVRELLDLPLLDLIWQAQQVHRQYNPTNSVQLATLLSVKTGGCPEDCAYCPQSAHHDTFVERDPRLQVSEVLWAAQKAREAGSTRFCMGWAWRQIRDGEEFDAMLDIVRGVKDLGLETCVTAGMLNEDQARRLAEAGLDAYNHNLDTSPEFYGNIISTRTYEDRLRTLKYVRDAGVTICSGGIIGMGESVDDRAGLLQQLATLDPHPESVPINTLVAVEGTPLADAEPVDPLDLVRMCATARILMPKSRVRLSAGRRNLTREAQVLCFVAGANSIFYGEALLTTDNNDMQEDIELLRAIGAEALIPQPCKNSNKSASSAPLPETALTTA